MDGWRSINDFRTDDLTPEERARLRRLLSEDELIHQTIEADQKARWFWSTLRVWAMWIGGVAIALTATMTWIKDIFRTLAGVK